LGHFFAEMERALNKIPRNAGYDVSIGPLLCRNGKDVGNLLIIISKAGFQLGHFFAEMERVGATTAAAPIAAFQLGHFFAEMERGPRFLGLYSYRKNADLREPR